MNRSQRIARINALISRPQGASLAQLMEELEVSRATANRDLETLRDGMNAPIVYDRDLGGYRFEASGRRIGPQYELPGLWFSSTEVQALLTVDHLLSSLEPGLLGELLNPFRHRIRRVAKRCSRR